MRATTCWTPKVSRATRALMMLELSPLLTAAKAPAESMPASSSVCRSKPRPVTWRPPKSGPSRRAMAEPTRPQPITTTCTKTPAALSRRRRPPTQYRAKLHPEPGPPRARRSDVPLPRRACRPAAPPGPWRPYHRRRATSVRARTTSETTRARAPSAQRPGRRVVVVEASRPAHLRQRRALLRGVRHAGGADHPDVGWHGLPLSHAVARCRRRRPADRGGPVLPTGGPRLPVRWWRLRGRHEEPRAVRGAGRRQRAADRLRADRRRLGLVGHGQHHLGVPDAQPAPRAHRGRPGRPARRRQPAWRPGVGQDLRGADLPVLDRDPGHDRDRADPAVR